MSQQQQTTEVSKTKVEPEEDEATLISFTQDEVVFIENVLVTLRNAIPNDMGENSDILEKIVMCEQIISARLDKESTGMGNSGGEGSQG